MMKIDDILEKCEVYHKESYGFGRWNITINPNGEVRFVCEGIGVNMILDALVENVILHKTVSVEGKCREMHIRVLNTYGDEISFVMVENDEDDE